MQANSIQKLKINNGRSHNVTFDKIIIGNAADLVNVDFACVVLDTPERTSMDLMPVYDGVKNTLTI